MRQSRLKFIQHFEAWSDLPARTLTLECGAEDLDDIVEEFSMFLKGCGFIADQVDAALSPVEDFEQEVERIKAYYEENIKSIEDRFKEEIRNQYSEIAKLKQDIKILQGELEYEN